jgi:dihydroorotate dehydrogenase electron transfer subunit
VRTEDGTRGEPGLAHTALGDFLEANEEHSCAVYACGPRPMLYEVARIGERYRVPTQVLMEETIACGLGACQGCVVRGTDGYLRVCTDGPVFDASRIDWLDAL